MPVWPPVGLGKVAPPGPQPLTRNASPPEPLKPAPPPPSPCPQAPGPPPVPFRPPDPPNMSGSSPPPRPSSPEPPLPKYPAPPPPPAVASKSPVPCPRKMKLPPPPPPPYPAPRAHAACKKSEVLPGRKEQVPLDEGASPTDRAGGLNAPTTRAGNEKKVIPAGGDHEVVPSGGLGVDGGRAGKDRNGRSTGQQQRLRCLDLAFPSSRAGGYRMRGGDQARFKSYPLSMANDAGANS